MGFIYIPVSLVVPALAGRFSGRSVMLFTFAICLLSPLAMAFLSGTGISALAYILFGNWAAATVPIFIYIIPRQTLPQGLIETASGIIMGASVLFGGCVSPLILGNIANTVAGIRMIMLVCCGMFAICILSAALLQKNKAKG